MIWPAEKAGSVSVRTWPSMPVMRSVKGPEPKPPSSLSVPSVSRRSSKNSGWFALLTSTLVTGTFGLRTQKLVHQMLDAVWNW